MKLMRLKNEEIVYCVSDLKSCIKKQLMYIELKNKEEEYEFKASKLGEVSKIKSIEKRTDDWRNLVPMIC